MYKTHIADLQFSRRATILLEVLCITVLSGLMFAPPSAFAETDTFVIASESMAPALQQYDIVVIDRDFPFEEIQVGDIILFHRPVGEDRAIVHRVVSIDVGEDGDFILTTKGDANPSPIPGTDYPVTADLYVGKVINVIPKIGLIAQFISPPMNYVIAAGIWGVIIYALYRRWKRAKPVMSSAETLMQPSAVFSAAENVIGRTKFKITKALPNQSIIAEGRREFRWSWMIVGIIFAWPAAIAYYFSSKKNSISVSISPKSDGQGSSVSIETIGRKGEVAVNELRSTIK